MRNVMREFFNIQVIEGFKTSKEVDDIKIPKRNTFFKRLVKKLSKQSLFKCLRK